MGIFKFTRVDQLVRELMQMLQKCDEMQRLISWSCDLGFAMVLCPPGLFTSPVVNRWIVIIFFALKQVMLEKPLPPKI